MGNCSSDSGSRSPSIVIRAQSSVQTALSGGAAKQAAKPAVLKRVALEADASAPSTLTGSAFVDGELPHKQTYLHFFWYLTAYQQTPEAKRYQKDRHNRWNKRDGLLRATVDDVSRVVNKAEGLTGRARRAYELQCDSALWRKGLQVWLARQGIVLTYDFEPEDDVQARAHKNLGMFEEGYSFAVYYTDDDAAGDSNHSSGKSVVSASTPVHRTSSSGKAPSSA